MTLAADRAPKILIEKKGKRAPYARPSILLLTFLPISPAMVSPKRRNDSASRVRDLALLFLTQNGCERGREEKKR